MGRCHLDKVKLERLFSIVTILRAGKQFQTAFNIKKRVLLEDGNQSLEVSEVCWCNEIVCALQIINVGYLGVDFLSFNQYLSASFQECSSCLEVHYD